MSTPRFTSLDDAIEELLLYLECAEFQPFDRKPSRHATKNPFAAKLPITYWNEAQPFLDEPCMRELRGNPQEREFLPPGDVTPEDLGGAWDVRMLKFVDPEEDPTTKLLLNRGRSQSLAEVRGRATLISPVVGELSAAHVRDNGAYSCLRFIGGYRSSERRWYDISAEGDTLAATRHTEMHNNMGMLLSIAFTDYFDWRVILGYEKGPTLSFVTDPVGVRAVFRLRDLPEGKSRREALRHWVRQHWRKRDRVDEEASIEVSQHLRGATHFRWHGLTCRIRVSPADTDRLKGVKAQRHDPRA